MLPGHAVGSVAGSLNTLRSSRFIAAGAIYRHHVLIPWWRFLTRLPGASALSLGIIGRRTPILDGVRRQLLEISMVGQITSLNHRRFGYIEADGKRYFFHAKELHDYVFTGDLLGKHIEFDPAEGDYRGPLATNVRPIAGPY